jgi:predicted outer membrane protein
MKLNATLLAALALVLAPLASRAHDDNKTHDTAAADQPNQDMNRDSSMKKSSDSSRMDRSGKGMTDQMVLRHLHHANMEEIKAGQMAESKASSPQVKDYARTLVQDHQQADKQVLAMADKMHVDMKKNMDMDQSSMDHSKMDHSKMDHSKTDQSNMDHSQMAGMDHEQMRTHQAKMDQMQKLSGKEFDQAFLTMMVNGHDHVIDMVKNAQSSASGDMKNMLDQMLPTLERHKQMAQDLEKSVGNTASAR